MIEFILVTILVTAVASCLAMCWRCLVLVKEFERQLKSFNDNTRFLMDFGATLSEDSPDEA
jgi:uncharacterized 2Fe-2S/4Fe-4S cluster protein (DUF4445 family)